MVQRQNLGRWASVVCALTINLCAAAPPDDGLTVGGGAGYGQYSYSSGGCGAPVYRNEANDLRAHARAQVHSREDHWSASLEGSYGQGEVTASELVEQGDEAMPPAEDPDQIGATKRSYAVALRVGSHWQYGGAEVGPAVFGGHLLAGSEYNIAPQLALSADAWAGVPDILYVWGSLLSGPQSPSLAPISFGLGHKGDNFRANLGFGLDKPYQLIGRVDFKLPIEQALWLGVMAHSSDETDRGVLLTIEVPLKLD